MAWYALIVNGTGHVVRIVGAPEANRIAKSLVDDKRSVRAAAKLVADTILRGRAILFEGEEAR